ncbi:non-ribosomal peptide synthetase [Actinocrispum sp. NPDC049592]|uniref:non-ribosomal peptide synthetase n=1 Tax=Actinocrispum sp. NPDC049592 TaxID=3154835 RepID=UPI00342CD442
MSSGKRFTRRVAPLERWYLGFPRALTPVLNLVVTGVGRVGLDELRHAVEVAGDSYPGTRLARHGSHWSDEGVPPRVRIAEGNDPVDHPALREPLTRNGRYCEVVLLDGPSVVFRASHAVTDARGLRMWAAAVFRALRGEELSRTESRRTILDLEEPLLNQIDTKGEEFSVPSLLGIPPRAERGEFEWLRRTVDGTYPAVVARMATELVKLSGLEKAQVSVPLDLRVLHPDLDSTSNLAITVVLDIKAGQTWAETHQQLLKVLGERQGTVHAPGKEILMAPLALLRRMIKKLDTRMRETDRFSGVANVSNLGRVDGAEFGTAQFEPVSIYMLDPPAPPSPLSLNIVESDGRTELTLPWFSGSRTRTEDVLDALCESLSPMAHQKASTLLPAEPKQRGEVPAGCNIVKQFRAQVAKNPHAVAISGPEGDVSYAELDHYARVVAAALKERGIGRDDVVGLLADRSVNAIAGAWGVLMAGAAYLPMDTKHPDGRIQNYLEDAQAPLCLVGKPHHERELPSGCERIVLEDLDYLVQPPVQETLPQPSDLAYVVYTSGSTGKPKGVEIEHRSLSNYAVWATREHGIDASARMPLLCSMSFDVAEISLILPFLVGGTLLLMRDDLNHLSLQEVFDAGANVIALTPSHLDLITRLELKPGNDVRALLVIGEQFKRSLAVRAQELFGPRCKVINLYGPAEATIAVSHHVFNGKLDDGATVPIGVPFDGVSMYVLDSERRFVAPGESGELYLGGIQLARGYRGRTDLTRQRFVYMADGTRAYRTGDIVQVLPSGELECAGRIDDQVKVHGHRIEPAEIALTLEDHPSVAAAVVIPRMRPGHTEKTLVGYVVTSSTVDTEDLRQHLGKTLPVYMIPSHILPVDEIPRTVNGKVAVANLPDPFESNGSAAPTEPLDETESAISRIWAQVLNLDVDLLNSSSDFHDLGGNSLTLITMVATVARELAPTGEEVLTSHMQDIIRRPTVAHVAELTRLAAVS